MQVAFFDGKGQAFALFGAAFLERRGGAEGCIEGDIVGAIPRGTRLDVPSVLAFGAGQRAASGLLAAEFIERGVELARREGLTGLYLLPALPPVRARVGERVLAAGFGLSLLGTFLFFIFEF